MGAPANTLADLWRELNACVKTPAAGAGSEVTIVFTLRRDGSLLGKPAEADYPKLMAWVGTIAARPAVVRALAKVDEVRTKTTQFDKADAEAMDRLFGRGKHAATA